MKNYRLSFAIAIISMALVVVGALLAEYVIEETVYKIAVIAFSVVLLCISIIRIAKTEHETNIYKCAKCGYEFKPSFSEYLCGMHTIRRRYLKCAKCGHRSMCLRKKCT